MKLNYKYAELARGWLDGSIKTGRAGGRAARWVFRMSIDEFDADKLKSYYTVIARKTAGAVLLIDQNFSRQTYPHKRCVAIASSGDRVPCFIVKDPEEEPSQQTITWYAGLIEELCRRFLRKRTRSYQWNAGDHWSPAWLVCLTKDWFYNAPYVFDMAIRFAKHFGLDAQPLRNLKPLFKECDQHFSVIQAGGPAKLSGLRKQLNLSNRCPLHELATIQLSDDPTLNALAATELMVRYGARGSRRPTNSNHKTKGQTQ